MSLNSTPDGRLTNDVLPTYDLVELITGIVISVLLIPLNCLIIRCFCQASQIRRPISWLFINLSAWDIAYLLFHIGWHWRDYVYRNQSTLTWCNGYAIVLSLGEKFSECLSAFATSAIAILRAVAVWEATKNRRSKTKKWAMVAIFLAVYLLSIVSGPLLVGINCAYPDGKQCEQTDLAPFGVSTQFVHSVMILVLVNGVVVVAYGYICIVLCRTRPKMQSQDDMVIRPHTKVLYILMAYTIAYTITTVPGHLNVIVLPDCASGDKGRPILNQVVDTVWLMASVGLNPVLLYACHKDLRSSISVIYDQVGSTLEILGGAAKLQSVTN